MFLFLAFTIFRQTPQFISVDSSSLTSAFPISWTLRDNRLQESCVCVCLSFPYLRRSCLCLPVTKLLHTVQIEKYMHTCGLLRAHRNHRSQTKFKPYTHRPRRTIRALIFLSVCIIRTLPHVIVMYDITFINNSI